MAERKVAGAQEQGAAVREQVDLGYPETPEPPEDAERPEAPEGSEAPEKPVRGEDAGGKTPGPTRGRRRSPESLELELADLPTLQITPTEREAAERARAEEERERQQRAQQRELYLAMDFSLRVGEVMLSNGAGVADVSVVVRDLARHYGVRNPDLDITFTRLSITYQADNDSVPLVLFRLVKQRDLDYEDLTVVDHLIRAIYRSDVDLREARSRLARVVSTGHVRPRLLVTLAWGTMCAGVGLMLGGSWKVVAIAFLAAVLIDRLQLLMSNRRIPTFYQQAAGGALATLLAAGINVVVPLDVSLVVSANIVMLLAGVGFMGALQDALSGFYLTASARLLEAVLYTAGIIAGVSFGLTLAETLGAEVGRLVPGRSGLDTITLSALGAAVCAAGFALASYAPLRTLLPVGLIAGAAMTVYQSMLSSDIARTWGAATGAVLVGLVAYSVSGKIRVPPLVVLVPAVVPMLPGLSIYRGLSLLAEGGSGTTPGLLSMVTAASVALAVASGVLLGEYVAQPVRREARRLENRLSGPRLVGSRKPH